MTRVQAVTRRVHERGVGWISAPGVRIGDGVPRVRRTLRVPPPPTTLTLTHALWTDPPPASPVRSFMRALFGSGNLWIALVFGLTLIR